MTSKDINKVQNEVKKASEKTLTCAVKAWCNLFKSGKAHKRFGYNEPVEYEGGVYYDVFNGIDKRIIKCAVPIKRYTFNLIAKCVTYYLTHPKNER